MKLFSYLTGHSRRMAELHAQKDEITRQQARIKLAYDLHREVLRSYGYEVWLQYMTDAELIIKDTKSITVINYLNI